MKFRCSLCGNRLSPGEAYCPRCGAKIEQAPEITLDTIKKGKRRPSKQMAAEESAVHVSSSSTPDPFRPAGVEKSNIVLAVLAYVFSLVLPIIGILFAGIGLEKNKKRKSSALNLIFGTALGLSTLFLVLWAFFLRW